MSGDSVMGEIDSSPHNLRNFTDGNDTCPINTNIDSLSRKPHDNNNNNNNVPFGNFTYKPLHYEHELTKMNFHIALDPKTLNNTIKKKKRKSSSRKAESDKMITFKPLVGRSSR